MNKTSCAFFSNPKKILIFLYLLFILIFFTLTLGILHVKSSYFLSQVDINAARILSENNYFNCHYREISGDFLSNLMFKQIKMFPKQNFFSKFIESVFFENIKISIYPVENILKYAFRTDIPVDINIESGEITTTSGTLAISILNLSLKFSSDEKNSQKSVKFDLKSSFESQFISLENKNDFFGISGEISVNHKKGHLAAKLEAYAPALVIGTKVLGLNGQALLFDISNFNIKASFDNVSGKATLTGQNIKIFDGELNIRKLEYDLRNREICVDLIITKLNTEKLLKACPLFNVLALSRDASIDVRFSGPADNLQYGSGSAEITALSTSLLEYIPEDRKFYTPLGFGDFVVSLGLTPELSAKAGTIEVSQELTGGILILKKLNITSENYKFEGAAAENSNHELNGNFKLFIPQKHLLNNTLNVDFSGLENGLNIYGKITGTLNDPHIFYDMDKAALLKITKDVMLDKFKNFWKSNGADNQPVQK